MQSKYLITHICTHTSCNHRLRVIDLVPLTYCVIFLKDLKEVKEKPQQDSRRGKFAFRINPIPARDTQRAQTNLVCTRVQRPHREWDRPVFECLLPRYRSAVGCRRGRGSGCSRLGYGISPFGRGHH